MRVQFHDELKVLDEQLCELGALATSAIAEAAEALLTADQDRVEAVLSTHTRLDSLRDEVQELAGKLLALQSPVAGELRSIFAALLNANELERMGGLAAHIAKIAQRRLPDHVVTGELAETFRAMGERAQQLGEHMCQVLREDDVELARELDQEDDVLDQLKQTAHDALLNEPEAPGAPLPESVQHAVDGVLLARFFERYGDHAVSVARRVIFRSLGGSPSGGTTATRSVS